MTQQEFLSRRQTLLAQMQPGSAALIFAAPEAVRSADSEYPYRQNSDFWYFTGFNEPEALLVLIKSDETHNHSVLFNRVRDLTAEIWFGRRLGQEAAPAKLGVDRALAFSEINQQLYQLLNGLDAIYFAQGEYAYADEIVFNALEKLRKGSRQNLQAPNSVIDWRPIVHEMRLFKSAEELAVMRRAGEIIESSGALSSVESTIADNWHHAQRLLADTPMAEEGRTALSALADRSVNRAR